MALAWLVAWIALAVRLRRVDGVAALGMLWFVVLLVPSAILVMLDLGEPMAEHRVYLSSAGMFLAVGTAFGRAWPLFGIARIPIRRVVQVPAGGLADRPRRDDRAAQRSLGQSGAPLAECRAARRRTSGCRTWRLGRRCRTWARTTRRSPSIGWRSRFGRASRCPYMKLGLCLAEMRRLDEAAQVFRKLERLTPRVGGRAERAGCGRDAARPIR